MCIRAKVKTLGCLPLVAVIRLDARAFQYQAEARTLEHHYPHTLKVTCRESQQHFNRHRCALFSSEPIFQLVGL